MHVVVLDSFAADQGELSWDALRALGTVTVHPRTPREAVVERARGADAILTNKVTLDRATLARLPALRYVGVVATGTNVVDVAACRERGVAVTNVPGYSTHSVAQLVFAAVLHFTHDVSGHDAAVKAGRWAASPDFVFCLQPLTELAEKTLVIVGTGAIGRAVSEIARAFGMRVLSAQVPGGSEEGRVPLLEALRDADVVSLHCPLTPRTENLVNAGFLAAMKPGAILVNTGRGGLVDDGALVAALGEGRLGGVALDVLRSEPPPADHPLLDRAAPFAKRVLVTPHIGWATVEARKRLVREVIENVAAFSRGERRNRVDGV
ncbi:MAG TPA: D-2-hydroxyacid dehydrogenase [Polyangiaceae bacterium]|nr:D-2-hydroxyacid dehydrogenase [Polyangiaceae bacterium]